MAVKCEYRVLDHQHLLNAPYPIDSSRLGWRARGEERVYPGSLETVLNDLGEEGWILCSLEGEKMVVIREKAEW